MSVLNGYPIIYALVLGLLVAFNPCQLAINLSALTFISRNNTGKGAMLTKGITYAAGRSTTYIIMAWLLTYIFNKSLTIEYFRNILSKAEDFLPYILFIIAAILIARTFHSHHHGEECHNCGNTINRNRKSGSFVLGAALAFAFCPESALFYFGMLIPSAVSCNSLPVQMSMPIIFAIGAALPVIIMAYLFTLATSNARKFEHKFNHFQQIVNIITAAIFVTIAILLLLE